MTKSKRIGYLDALKGICILLVVFCHHEILPMDSVPANVLMTVAWAAVPCFMMTSGALAHRANSFTWGKYFRRLLKMYSVIVIWRLICLLFFSNLQPMQFGKAAIVQYLFFMVDLAGVDTGVMWYMLAYLTVWLMYPLTYYLYTIKTKEGQRLRLFLLLLTFCSGVFLPTINWGLGCFLTAMGRNVISIENFRAIFPLNHYANMLFYFILGSYMLEYEAQIRNALLKRIHIPLLMFLLGTVGLMLVKYLNTGFWSWQGLRMTDGYTQVATVFMALGMYLFFLVTAENRMYEMIGNCIGQHTMGVYYMHILLLKLCRIYLYPQVMQYASVGVNCIKTLGITMTCVLITLILKKIPYVSEIVK